MKKIEAQHLPALDEAFDRIRKRGSDNSIFTCLHDHFGGFRLSLGYPRGDPCGTNGISYPSVTHFLESQSLQRQTV